MERHGIDEEQAFEMLRMHARSTNRKIVDVAESVLVGHSLLPGRPADRHAEAEGPKTP